MRRFFLLPPLILVLVGLGFTAAAHAASSTYAYSFQLGFATITNLLLTDNVALAPTDNEGHNSQNGDGLQHAVSIKDGKPILLVWRKADNWTAATDGYLTWVNGPNGLQKRLNTERFSFEANPDMLSGTVGLPLASTAAGGVSAATYTTLLNQYEQSHPVVPRWAWWDISTAPSAPPVGGQPTPPNDINFQPKNRAELMPLWLNEIPWHDGSTTNGYMAGQLQDYSITDGNVVLLLTLDKGQPKKITTVTITLGHPYTRIGFVSDHIGFQQTPFFVAGDALSIIEGINYYNGGIGSFIAVWPNPDPYNARNGTNIDFLIGFAG